MEQIVLCNRNEFKLVEKELRSNFIRNTIIEMGVPLDEVWEENKLDFTVNEKIELRNILEKYNILILDDHEGGTKIYLEDQCIAEWKKSRIELVTDYSVIDPNKKIYCKMYIDCKSVFDILEEKEE